MIEYDMCPPDFYDAMPWFSEDCIIVGEQALMRNGLTNLVDPNIQVSIDVALTCGLRGKWLSFYFSPWAKDFRHTSPSKANPLIHVPTAERALIEYMCLLENFSEGILEEGMRNYLWRHNDDPAALYEEASLWHCPVGLVDYWVSEARAPEEG